MVNKEKKLSREKREAKEISDFQAVKYIQCDGVVASPCAHTRTSFRLLLQHDRCRRRLLPKAPTSLGSPGAIFKIAVCDAPTESNKNKIK